MRHTQRFEGLTGPAQFTPATVASVGSIMLICASGDLSVSLGANEGDDTNAVTIPQGGHVLLNVGRTFTIHGSGDLEVITTNLIATV